jgi:hypothetical protein
MFRITGRGSRWYGAGVALSSNAQHATEQRFLGQRTLAFKPFGLPDTADVDLLETALQVGINLILVVRGTFRDIGATAWPNFDHNFDHNWRIHLFPVGDRRRRGLRENLSPSGNT